MDAGSGQYPSGGPNDRPLGMQEGTFLTNIAGYVPEGSGGHVRLYACGREKLDLEGMEDGDEKMYVVDTKAHLTREEGGEIEGGREGGRERGEREKGETGGRERVERERR